MTFYEIKEVKCKSVTKVVLGTVREDLRQGLAIFVEIQENKKETSQLYDKVHFCRERAKTPSEGYFSDWMINSTLVRVGIKIWLGVEVGEYRQKM